MMAGSKPPKFAVLSNMLIAVALIGVCLKLASQSLPENQPNSLASEYGDYLRSASRHQVKWNVFSKSVFEMALIADKPIYLELGSPLSNDSRRRTVEQFVDEEFWRLLNDQYLSVRVDLLEMPWVGECLETNPGFVEAANDSVASIVSPEGEVYLQGGIRELYSDREPAGEYNWVFQAAKTLVDSRSVFDSNVLQRAAEQEKIATQIVTAGTTDAATSLALQKGLAESFDDVTGLLRGGETPLATPLFECMLQSEDLQKILELALVALVTSPSYDAVDGGVFFRSRSDGFHAPVLAKHAGLCAQFAAVLAEAFVITKNPIFERAALQTADLLISKCRRPSGLFGGGVQNQQDSLGHDPYYSARTDGGSAKDVSLAFDFSTNPEDLGLPILKTQVENSTFARAVNELRAARNEFPPPAALTATYADINGQVIAGLYRAARALSDSRIRDAADSAYRSAMQRFVQPLGDVQHAPIGIATTTGYLGDYAWICRAAIERYRTIDDPEALADARRVMIRSRELFFDPLKGYSNVLRSLIQFAPCLSVVQPVADSALPSLAAVHAINIHDIAQIDEDPELQKHAVAAFSVVAGSYQALSRKGLGLAFGVIKMNNPVWLYSEDLAAAATEYKRRFPHLLIARNSKTKISGISITTSGIKSGPHTWEQFAKMLPP